jgi:hypothetical protein
MKSRLDGRLFVWFIFKVAICFDQNQRVSPDKRSNSTSLKKAG